MSRGTLPARRGQRGIALMTSVLLLIVLTIMALSMMRSYGVEERIAGNTRDKQRAFNAAVSAQQYAEYWLASGTAPASTTCGTGLVAMTAGEVCTNAITNLNVLPWSTGVNYTQFTTAGGNGVMAAVGSGVGNYYSTPTFYIQDLGAAPGALGNGELYQVDAVGYGGSAATVAIVESTYLISINSLQDPTQP